MACGPIVVASAITAIPSLLYLIGEAAFVFMAYYAKTDIPYR